MKVLTSFTTAALLTAALAACSSSPPGTGGTPFTPQNAYSTSGEVPAGAQVVSKDDFLKAAGSNPDFLTKAELDAFNSQVAAEASADEKVVSDFLKDNPASAYLLENEGGQQTPEGDFILSVPAPKRVGSQALTERVVTLGRKSTVATMAANLRNFSTVQNQTRLYENLYENLTPELRQEAQLPTLEQARQMSRSDLLATTDRASQFISQWSSDGLLKERIFDKVSIFKDVGAGSGKDTAVSGGSCPQPSANGIYKNFDWPLKQFTTSVKNQGTRGTCWSFAVTAAAELFATKASGSRVNLSEQEFAARTLTQWNPRDFGEGNDALAASRGAFNDGYRFAYESGWEYNQSQSRVVNTSSYSNSCVGYNGTACSDTNFQGIFVCYLAPTSSYCVRTLPTVNDRSDIALSEPFDIWSQERNPEQNTAVLVLRALLGQPTVLSFKVATGFDNPDANGFVTDSSFGQATRGQHVALITGFVFNNPLHQILPNAPFADGDGYFIVKNSWGCAVGDAGYYYLPQRFVQRYAVGANGYY